LSNSYIYRAMENVAAVSACLHTNDKYREAYDKHGEALGGFPAFYDLAVVASDVFSKTCMARLDRQWGLDNWLFAVELYTDSILVVMLDDLRAMLDGPVSNLAWDREALEALATRAWANASD
jgi:hypothetical protein